MPCVSLFPALAVVELGQTAFAGFTEPMVQVHAGFLHGPANHIIADIPGAGEEIAEIAGIQLIQIPKNLNRLFLD